LNRIFAAMLFMALCCSFVVAQDQKQDQQKAPSASAATSAAPAKPPEELARQYVELWNTGDENAIKQFPGFIMHAQGPRILVQPAILSRVIGAWRKSMPDLKFTIEDTIVQGDKVAMRLAFTGSYKERLFPATGDPAVTPRHVRSTEMLFFRIEKGKIAEIWEEYNEMIMRLQMGGQWRSNAELEAQAKPSHEAPPKVEIPPPPQ
jgi:predicted ester cyclase